ncbi:MAG: TlpA disulfide reductase family protein [Chryseolinea sp.]
MRTFKTFVVVASLLMTNAAERQTLPTGDWRGEFVLQNSKRIPFNFVVEGKSPQTLRVSLKNGKERAPLDSVYFKGDSVVIGISIYDAVLVAKLSDKSLNGFLRKNQSPTKGLPFEAIHNQNFRFKTEGKSATSSVSGKWSVTLTTERDGASSARYTVGLLEQEGSKVTGTILTTTGDYRYLEGVVDGTKLRMSAFSGSSPTMIEADIKNRNELSGEFISPGGTVRLEAVKNDTAKLPDPYRLTHLRQGYDRLSFSFPNLNGKSVSLKDEKYKGKVVILTVLGSWCPNCIDEAAFLAPWYKQNNRRGVEIVGVAFERKDDFNFAKSRLDNLVRRFDIKYDILFAGIADKKVAAEKFPELNTFLSFPTTLFIDKKGKVRKVHTGYTGPATGEYYEDFIKEFNDEVTALLNESPDTL